MVVGGGGWDQGDWTVFSEQTAAAEKEKDSKTRLEHSALRQKQRLG